MFDVGFLEIVLLLVVGLIVLGPERLPKAARTIGAYLRKARSAWSQVKYDIDRELQASELKDSWQQSVREAGRDFSGLRDEVDLSRDVAGLKRDLNENIDLGENTAAAPPATTDSPAAADADRDSSSNRDS
ncbi:MAG: hypothetical protein Tsb002_05090 [Wenzhouxiangellaceae bacterium]